MVCCRAQVDKRIQGNVAKKVGGGGTGREEREEKDLLREDVLVRAEFLN